MAEAKSKSIQIRVSAGESKQIKRRAALLGVALGLPKAGVSEVFRHILLKLPEKELLGLIDKQQETVGV